ncbi:right-handed parallel beta-helix repeat-containing protein [Deinococcus marmoris]|uniref:right-handed parallel beta-helix repeat-containing protein n=3 Tax=Deinococcus marmoris TaxID=249408 RepID=UPI001FDF728A|nr:right-handed parallel beta-helix repeat-containing protein [Deinococcus marmoris]
MVPAVSSTATFEAESAGIETLLGQGVVEVGAPTGGEIIDDKAASGGKAVNLLGNGSTVQFTVASNFATGNYAVNLRGRGVMYAGSPIVSVRINGTEKTRVTLTSESYGDFTLPPLDLKAGDRVSVTFINDAYAGRGKDRNAVIDYVTLTLRGSGTPVPAPAPVPSPAPTPAPSGNYTRLATEGAAFTVSGTQTVRYGQGSSWIAKSVTGSGQCTNDFFGHDPAYGISKVCEVLVTNPSVAPAPVPAPVPTPVPAPTPVPLPTPVPTGSNAVSVKDFGAKGDGVTDDTAALRRAAATRGKDIVFPAGTYLTRGVIVFDGLQNQTVSGSGATLQAVAGFVRDRDNAVLYVKNSRNVKMSGLAVQGNRVNTSSAGSDIDGVRVAGSQQVTLSRMTVGRAPTNGVTIVDSQGVQIEDSAISANGRHGIWSWKSNDVRFLRNSVTGRGQNPDGGIGILATVGTGFLAQQNTISNTGDTGTKTEAVNNVVYRDNTVNVFGKDGIKVMPHPPSGVTQVSNAVVEGNTISGYRGWVPEGSGSILMQSVIGGTVRGNTVTGTGGSGGSRDEDGIRVNTYGSGPRSSNIQVTGNTIRNSVVGLRMNADNLAISGNRVQSTGYAAVLGGRGISLSSNPELRSGANITVLYDIGTQADVTANVLSGSDVGIYAANSGNQGRISGNTFASSYRRQVVAGSSVTVTP